MPLTQRLLCTGLLLAVPLLVCARDLPDAVRVRLFEKATPQALVVSAEHGLQFFAGDAIGTVLAELPPHQEATIRIRGDDLYVQYDEMAFFALSLRLIPHDETLFEITVTEGASSSPRQYPGHLLLEVEPSATPVIKLINHVLLDDYVACVVGREYGFNDLEGTKAMAILARTYVLRAAGKFGDDYDLVDHRIAQQYDGADRLTESANLATRLTQGEVLTYNDELVEAVYFSSSGGHTADNDAVWQGNPVPYLRGVPDPYDATSPHASWRTTTPRTRLLQALSDKYGFSVEGFVVGSRSPDGRVQSIELLRQNQTARVIRSNEFRLLFNQHFGKNRLKSTRFDVRRDGDQYVFAGGGYGHGVGLSQYGALEMSRQGFSYRDILAYYFTGTRVQSWDLSGSDRPVLTATPVAAPVRKVSNKSKRRGW